VITDQGITKFINLADESPQVPNLQRKTYADFRLTQKEWAMLDLLRQILKHPALAQQQFSSERVPTVSKVFPIIEFLLSALEAAKKDKAFEDIHDAIVAGVSNLEKWYRKLDACHVYAVCNGASNDSNPIIHSPMD
jgi:endonuclease IV